MVFDQETFDTLPIEARKYILGKTPATDFLHAYEMTFGNDRLQQLAYVEDIVEYVLREYSSCDSDTKRNFSDALNGKNVIYESVQEPVAITNFWQKLRRFTKKCFHGVTFINLTNY